MQAEFVWEEMHWYLQLNLTHNTNQPPVSLTEGWLEERIDRQVIKQKQQTVNCRM